jgi:hypothetical protein
MSSEDSDDLEDFRHELYQKRRALRIKIGTLREKFPDHVPEFIVKAEKDSYEVSDEPSSVDDLRKLRVVATFTTLDSIIETFLLYEQLVTGENKVILQEIVDCLMKHAENVFDLTLTAEGKNMWAGMIGNLLIAYPSIDRWLDANCKPMAGLLAISGICGIVFLGSGLLCPAILCIGLTLGGCFVYWQRRRSREASRNASRDASREASRDARMAKLTYDHLKELKDSANLENLKETFQRLRQTCQSSYTQWLLVLPEVKEEILRECGICLTPIVPNDKVGRPLCGNEHSVVYHYDCVRQWEGSCSSFTCPLCRVPCLIQQGVCTG